MPSKNEIREIQLENGNRKPDKQIRDGSGLLVNPSGIVWILYSASDFQ